VGIAWLFPYGCTKLNPVTLRIPYSSYSPRNPVGERGVKFAPQRLLFGSRLRFS
jgi:hypothetical protein